VGRAFGAPLTFTLDNTNMTSALRYDDLDMNRVDGIFDEKGELLVSLPPNHASALISFIETTQVAQSWSKSRTPFLARLVPLAKGLLVTLRITIKHSRLFELGRVVVLNSASQTWEKLPDGHVLFRFVR
jgi:hypothetical protein